MKEKKDSQLAPGREVVIVQSSSLPWNQNWALHPGIWLQPPPWATAHIQTPQKQVTHYNSSVCAHEQP